jgi:hypothetical protein
MVHGYSVYTWDITTQPFFTKGNDSDPEVNRVYLLIFYHAYVGQVCKTCVDGCTNE